MACSCITLFNVFVRKNLLYLKYNCVPLCITFSCCILIIWAYLHGTNTTVHRQIEQYETKDYVALKEVYFPGNDDDLVYYAPNTNNVRSLMELVRQELEISEDRMRAYNESLEMQMTMEQQCRGSCFGVHFQELNDPDKGGPFKYSLSSNQIRSSPEKRFVNDEDFYHQKDDDEYIRVGFLSLQYIVDRQYMRYQNIEANFDLQFSSMPNLELKNSNSKRLILFGTLFSILFSLLLLSTFVVPFVEEKQNGLKEFLNLVTPMSFLNGLSFFLIRFVCYAIFVSIIIIVGWRYEAFGKIGLIYIFPLYLLYIIANMSYGYLISVCFHSVFYAKIGGLLLLIIPYLFDVVRSQLSELARRLFCTSAFVEGLNVLQTFTNKHREFASGDLVRLIKDDAWSLLAVYLTLIFQIILYALLYNYFVCVFPGPGGLKRPMFFFLNPQTYKKRQRNEYTTSPRGTEAIIISDLCKKFKSTKRETQIADHLNMIINNKEITVLLGHNGAGKTTIMNMIMGLVPKDAGKIVVCSERDVASYRHLIGFCPQHSVFMSYMTCQQHLEFFAELRDVPRSTAREWAKEKLQKLNLHDKANEYGQNLSGGMKRRLSLGIALAGNTKIVILDEPSSGLDIESRRELWDILLRLRKEKAILVTTHYMEGAEVLGDTICILANGKLQAKGSPLQLKRESGSGYRLKLQVHKENFQEKNTLDMIHSSIPSAYVQNVVKPTVYICLQYDQQTKFQDMFRSLEANLDKLGIESMSISDTSLESVFLNCAGEKDQVDSPDGATRNDAPLLASHQWRPANCMQLWQAIMYKKITFLINEWRYTCCMLSLPIIFVSCVILLMHAMSVVTNEAALQLQLSRLRTGSIYIHNPTGHHANVEEQLRAYIEKSGLQVKTLTLRGNNTVSAELLQLQKDNLADFLEDTIGLLDMYASTGDTPVINVYYAGNRYHSTVMLVNMLDTCMLQLYGQHPDASINATYLPIKRFITDVSPYRLEYYVVFVTAAMFFSMFYYISLPFREHSNGFRQLQAMSRYTYWSATFVFDMLTHALLCLVLFLLQVSLMPAELYDIQELQLIVMSIFLYGCSCLPILYALGNNFKSISTISTYLLLMLIVSEIAPLITSSSLETMKQHSTAIAFLCFLPDFNLNHQLRIINANFLARQRNALAPVENTAVFFVYALFVCGLVMGFFTIVLENKYYCQKLGRIFQIKNFKNAVKSSRCTSIGAASQELDCVDDCSLESERVKRVMAAGPPATKNFPLIANNLHKYYNANAAVDGLSFLAERGECFGLLGVNGAGKTSTFQMIAANLAIDDGLLQIDGIDIRLNEVAYRQRFGYCPQYDALNKFMTAEQCLHYMALLRGLSNSKDDPVGVEKSVNYWLNKMDLNKYRDVQVRHYSGGTKRKLLAAMAMIGSPSLVLLDEPTTGVDPISRRFLWQCIKDFQDNERTVLLTSHSMDECEELCNRLAIMANGKFKCLNNISALKHLSGFTIKLKMKSETEGEVNVENITRTLKQKFDGVDLRESHAGTLTYFVKTELDILWSQVFQITQEVFTHDLGDLVEHYSVNECTLEDIFLKFEKKSKSLPRAGVSDYV